ncbi:MAG: MoxR family ATPase [Firmicutes bacterium]|nr:MoxR family ATPase [Bacillota bacterium]
MREASRPKEPGKVWAQNLESQREQARRCIEVVRSRIVGLDDQVELAVRAVSSGLPVMLEGESGTGKTELAKAIAAGLGKTVYRVDGTQELTATKIQGWFDPPLVIKQGYGCDSFIPGPLAAAMRDGGLFFFNETSRAPSEALNAVLSALDERLLYIPRLTPIEASPGFCVVFTLNPVDKVGTNPLPRALYDRCVWIQVPHLDVEEAARVVRMRTANADDDLVRGICRVVELTRTHDEVASGASVRSAIHISRLLMSAPEGIDPWDPGEILRCAHSALSRNIKMKYDAVSTADDVIRQAVEEVFGQKKA